MTTDEITNKVSHWKWPNWTLMLVGGAALAFGVTNPEQSNAIVGGLISLFLGWANSNRQGIKEAAGSTNEVVDTTLRVALGAVAEGMHGLRVDLDAKHEENKRDHESLLAVVQKERSINNQERDGDRERIKKLEDGQERLVETIGDVKHELGQLGGKIDAMVSKGTS